MKKLIYCAAALATALFAGSCQRELLDPAAEGNTVTFTVEIPEVATKAVVVEDGSNINNLVYAVYRTEASDLATAATSITPDMLVYSVNPKATGGATKFTKEGKTNVTLELINNQKYIVLFWAQVDQTWVAGKDFDLTEIAYPAKLVANKNKYAAFAGAAYVEVTGASRQSVTLTRPFAQINLATANPTNYVVDIVSSSVKVDNVYPTFNVATKKAYGELRTVEYTTSENPDGSFGDYAHYVAMNYIFANPKEDGTTQVKVTCTMDTENHGTGIVKEISNVPVAQNYKTNIVGNLLTSDVDYEVTLKKDWDKPSEEIVLVNTASGLQGAIENAEPGVETEIKLDGDIDLNDLAALLATPGTLSTKAASAPSSLIIPSEKKVILNLNGYTLTQTVDYAGHSMIVNNGNLTLKGEGIICYTYNGTPDTSNSKGNQTISNFGTLVLDGPTVENATAQMSHARFAIDTREGAICNIISGEVRCPNSMAIRMGQFGPDANVLNITGGHIYGARAVQVHLPSSSATVNPVMTLNVQGGCLESNDEEYNIGIYVISNGQSAENVAVTVGGEAQIKGNVLVNAAATNTMKSKAVKITGGAITGEVYSYSDDQEKADDVISVTGGTFDAEPNYVDDAYKCQEQNGKYVVVKKPDVAKIDETGYWSLNAAVAAVQDGETITLVTNETFTAENRTHNSGSYYDGLYYVGDKSFTIDLGGFTVEQDGAVNDYLLNFKNDGAKANVITLKNGTVDAGTAAFCALCTSGTSTQELTINLEGVNLINNMSNGSTLKIRGAKTTLNVKSGTKITGKNSYLGIESWQSTINIYDGAEIYMNGTSSYNGCLVGVGGNGTVNVYGGYGKGVRGGFIAMTSGGVINVEGGEWIANTDGTVGDNSNLYVLTAQNNKYESGYAGASIINVTGGTFRGGMDAWILNDVNVEKAELNISGGNFNANPTRYLAEGCEANEVDGIWTVRVSPVAKIGEVEYETLEDAVAAAKANETITVLRDVTLSEDLTLPAGIIFNGNGKQINGTIYAGGDLTFAGHTKVTLFSASYYNRTITIGEGACLEVTSTGRVTLGYGNTFNITGSIENAETADKANIHPSLIIPGGISITGGNDAAMNVTNAYVTLGNTSSKNSAANGEFTWNINNSIVDFTNQFTLSEPTNGMNPKFIVNVENSVLTTVAKFCIAAPNSTINVNNSSITTSNNVRNSGTINLTNGSTLSGNTIQFGENGGNDGTINVDASKLYITATSTGHAFDGKESGEIILKNGAEATVTYYKDMTITNDGTCNFTGTKIQ